ncbi:MAG: tetratricopeptide repeat protein [Thermoguttaceae bacterium]
MHRHNVNFAFFAVMLALLAGCRLPCRQGPVSQSLVESRKLSRQGVAALENGQQQQAEKLLWQAVAVCPADAEARRNYAETLWLHGSSAEAIAQMEQAVQNSGDDADFWARLAEMYLAVGKVEPAETSVQEALDLNPKLPLAWSVRGGVMRATNRPHQALADYLHALRYAPGDRKILFQVAELYHQLDQPDRALQMLQTLSDSYAPGEEPREVLYATALAYSALGRHGEAADTFSTVIHREKPTPALLARLGEEELLAGRPEKADAAARQALTLDPKYQPTLELSKRIELARRTQDPLKVVR